MVYTECGFSPPKPASGVNITVKGSNIGTVSDMDGAYCISPVYPGDILVFTYLGHNIEEITLYGNPTCDTDICFSQIADVILDCDDHSV